MEINTASLRILAIFLFLLFCHNIVQAEPQVEKKATVRLPSKIPFLNADTFGETKEWDYLLYLPDEYKESRTTWPLMIYLHGSSLRGAELEKLKRYGPPSFLDKKGDFPFVVISPQLAEGETWEAKTLMPLINDIIASHKIDKERICLTGVSMGAIGVYNLAAEFPHTFSAIVPICGYGEVGIAKDLKHTPIWAFHGEHDRVVPIASHKRLIDAIGKAGGQAKLSIVPEGTHGNIIFPIYQRQSMYDWLLAQTRQPKSKPIKKFIPDVVNKQPTDTDDQTTPTKEPKQLEIKKPKLPILNVTQKANHSVKRGETLWGISRKYGVKLDQLIKINKLDSDRIDPGQVLVIPIKEQQEGSE